MSACLTTLYTPNYKNFAPIAIKSFEKFCERYDFNLAVYDSVFEEERHPSWNKLFAIQSCFNAYEYVFWCDIDSIYLDNEENFFSFNNLFHKKFVTYNDGNGICASHMFILNNEYNQKLIETALFLGDVKDNNRFNNPDPKWEQNTFKALLDHFHLPIEYFPKKTIINYDQDDFDVNTCFIHYHSISSQEREYRMKKTFDSFYN
jgi:hypothetical protein